MKGAQMNVIKTIIKKSTLVRLTLLVGMWTAAAQAQTLKYPPIERYLMPQPDEIALAKTAAPANISERATIKVLTRSGFEIAQQGDNGSVCMVMRGFSAPTYTPAQFRNLVYDATVRAPICFTEPAARTVMPYYELRTKLALQGKSPDEIAEDVAAAYSHRTMTTRWLEGMPSGPRFLRARMTQELRSPLWLFPWMKNYGSAEK